MSPITFQYQARCGMIFNVTPSLAEAISTLTDSVRAEVKLARESGKFVGYLSVPVSSAGGGDFITNTNMALSIANRVMNEFGQQLWILNPAAYNLPKGATGGDYMAVWADVLTGSDGRGADFDLAYFVGPHDVWELLRR